MLPLGKPEANLQPIGINKTGIWEIFSMLLLSMQHEDVPEGEPETNSPLDPAQRFADTPWAASTV